MPYRAERYRCALLVLVTLAGCNNTQPRSIDTFELKLMSGIFSYDLQIRNKNPQPLKSVNLTITIYTETETKQLTRNWGHWANDEVKTVNIPTSWGPIQGYVLSGTALVGSETVSIRADYTVRY